MNYLSILTFLLTAHVVTAAFIVPPQSLERCAKRALVGSNTAGRVVTTESDEYTDARLGEKIQ